MQVGCALRLTVGSNKCLVIDTRDINEVNVLEGDTETKVLKRYPDGPSRGILVVLCPIPEYSL